MRHGRWLCRGWSWCSLFAWLVALPCACDPPPVTPAVPVLAASSLDGGAPVKPTATLTLSFSLPLDPDSVTEDTVVLVRGTIDDDFEGKLERAAVPDDQRDLIAPIRLTLAGATLSLRPALPLAGDTLYTLVVTTNVRAAGQRLAAPIVRALQTLPASEGAPWITLLLPANGDLSVVRNLRQVELAFSRPVVGVSAGTLHVIDENGVVIAATVADQGDAQSFVLSLLAPLLPLRAYQVAATTAILDDEGEGVFALDPPPGFTAGTELRVTPPAITAFELSASSGCLVASLTAPAPVDARLCVDGGCADEAAMLLFHQMTAPLDFGARALVTMTARDASTAPPAQLGPLAAPATSPRTVVITEVLSRPLASHYTQQFVELQNVGAQPVALGGLSLTGIKGANQLPAATLAAGGYALIVPSGFVADDGADAPPAPGTLLVHAGEARLVGDGILVHGELLALVEPDGRLASRFSTLGLDLALGQSASRVDPCDLAGAYQPTAGGGASPGGP